MPDASPVLSVVIRKFREADEESVNAVLGRFEAALQAWPGFLGVRHNHPSSEAGGAMATVISFKSLDDLIAWEQSDIRKKMVEELSHFIEGEVVKNQLWDLDALLGTNRPPKKWKTVLVLIICVFAVGAVLGWLADAVSPNYPTGFARYAILLIINIVLNSYIFLPKSMALLHRIEARIANRN